MSSITLYLGLDVHKDSITIAIAEPGPKGELRLFGTITNDMSRLEHALGPIRKAHPDAHLELAYEAGPCGFVIARRLKQLKVPWIIPPAGTLGRAASDYADLAAEGLRLEQLDACSAALPCRGQCWRGFRAQGWRLGGRLL